jgi:hypothetical protein
MPARSVPQLVTPRFDTIVGLTDAVCRTHLTDEYAALARELAAALVWVPENLARRFRKFWPVDLTPQVRSSHQAPSVSSASTARQV